MASSVQICYCWKYPKNKISDFVTALFITKNCNDGWLRPYFYFCFIHNKEMMDGTVQIFIAAKKNPRDNISAYGTAVFIINSTNFDNSWIISNSCELCAAPLGNYCCKSILKKSTLYLSINHLPSQSVSALIHVTTSVKYNKNVWTPAALTHPVFVWLTKGPQDNSTVGADWDWNQMQNTRKQKT